MKENNNTVLIGRSVVLVPYRKEHVEIYHEWMQDPYLQEMTASEPLSLDEEHMMQQSWAVDQKKCTFIVLCPGFQGNRVSGRSGALGGMIGDVNLYFNDHDDEHLAEIEVMIAETEARRHGLGLETTQMMMRYGSETLGVRTFRAKISLKNEASLRMFTEKLAFVEVSRSEIFQEVTLERQSEQLDSRTLYVADAYL